MKTAPKGLTSQINTVHVGTLDFEIGAPQADRQPLYPATNRFVFHYFILFIYTNKNKVNYLWLSERKGGQTFIFWLLRGSKKVIFFPRVARKQAEK